MIRWGGFLGSMVLFIALIAVTWASGRQHRQRKDEDRTWP